MAIKISNTTVIADSRSLTNIVDISSSGISTFGSVSISSGIVTATSGVVTYYGDGRSLTGVGVGIQSGGQQIGAGITQLNFIGVGNTFRVSGNTVDIGIAGGGGALQIRSAGAIAGTAITTIDFATGVVQADNVSGIATLTISRSISVSGRTGSPISVDVSAGIATVLSRSGNVNISI